MGRSTRRVQKERMSQTKLDLLIQPKPEKIEREHIDPKPILSSDVEYDTLYPEEIVKKFCIQIREMLARYQYDKEQYDSLEQEMQDILHYIEMGTDKNANIGYKLYKRLAEVRRERRASKNEMELLQPVYDVFSKGDLLNTLSQLQGACKATKQSINARSYFVRTDVLNPFIESIKGRD